MNPLLPFVSLVAAVRNEEDFIERCLDSVLTQTYPQDRYEILLADGCSTDQTRSIVRRLQESHPNLILLDNPLKYVPGGLNRAIRASRGEYILRFDGHTTLAPDYVETCVRKLQTHPAGNVGGKMSAVAATPFGRAVASATSSSFGIGGGKFHVSNREEEADTVYLGAWPRSVFEEIGLFDEEMIRNQDDEFNYRLRESGRKILLCPDIVSEYTPRSTPSRLWSQYFQYGMFKVRVFQLHPAQMQLRQFVPAAFVLSLLASLAISPFSRLFAILFGVILLLYLSASIFAALKQRKADPQVNFFDLLLCFWILHFSYGTGFLCGLFRFAGKWGKPSSSVGRLDVKHAA